VGDDSHFVLPQKVLGENGSVRRGVVMVKQPGLFWLMFGATSLHVSTQSPQKRRSRTQNSIVWPVDTGASRYHSCCIDGGISPEYF
jgi:hypothetical protein